MPDRDDGGDDHLTTILPSPWGRCQVCGAPSTLDEPILCRICGEPVLLP